MIRVFIGFDRRETVAFHVLSHSIHAHATEPVAIAPIALHQLEGTFRREHNALQSTDFSFSRFLAPSMCGFEGWSLFLDCDMLFLDDIAKLWALRDDRHAVMVVKHDYVPKEEVKFLGAVQTKYEKKNWSSVMLFNNAKCKALTSDYVNTATGLQLHQFKWLGDDSLIGELPRRWNHLVGEYDFDADAGNVHFTIGGPYFTEYSDCDYADAWRNAREEMLRVDQRTQAPAVAAGKR
jgi:lipopolysaccharide biosynthesis glycosyltransferase